MGKPRVEIRESPVIKVSSVSKCILKLNDKVMEYNYFIGVDVSKATLDFAVRYQGAPFFHLRVPNTLKGIRSFMSASRKNGTDLGSALFCMEHTGVYGQVLARSLTASGHCLWVEPAIAIKRSLGLQRGKNDKVDAERIAEYAQRFADRSVRWEPPREAMERLRHLTALRSRLIETKNQLCVALREQKGRIGKDIHKEVEQLSRAPIRALEKQIKEVCERIRELVGKDRELSALRDIVMSVDGIGEVTFWEMAIATNGFKHIREAKKFACYCGVAPFEHSSGSSIRGRTRVSKMANKRIKKLLHMAAMSAVNMNGELRDFYLRKVAQGKSKMAMLNAIRNKLIHRIFACVRDGRKYEKSYVHMLA